jgi:hypothetical protein
MTIAPAQVFEWARTPDGSHPAPIAAINAAASSADDGTKGAAAQALRLFGLTGQVDLDNAPTVALLDQLAAAGLVTAGQLRRLHDLAGRTGP